MTDVVIGVDSSTQSCTVEVRDAGDGRLMSTARTSHPVTYPPVSEQHPDSWWDALVEAVRTAMDGLHVQVRALSVGAQCHGMVAMDGTGAVLRPAKLWNDTTSAPQAAAMVERFGATWWSEQIGLVPSAALTITKLAWLRDNEPDSFDAIAHVCLPHDWLTYKLSGRRVTERSDASGTGYFSADTMRWRTDILEEAVAPKAWASALPEVLGPNDPAGRITREAADALGISRDALVGPGGGDQHLAAQGIGIQVGDVAYSLGTSGVVFATTPHPVKDPTGGVDGVANTTGGYLPLVCTLNAAKVTDTFARLLGVTHGELNDLALQAELDPDRPVLAAYLDGERSPRLPWAHGMLASLTNGTTREQIALAAFEGVSLGLLRGERLISSHSIDTSGRTILIGGGARGSAYRQVIADLTGRPSHTVDAPEATARGAAVQAAAVARGESVETVTAEWAPPITSTTHPGTSRTDVWPRYVRLTDIQAAGQTF